MTNYKVQGGFLCLSFLQIAHLIIIITFWWFYFHDDCVSLHYHDVQGFNNYIFSWFLSCFQGSWVRWFFAGNFFSLDIFSARV